MRKLTLLLLIPVLQAGSVAAPTVRVPDYPAALESAKQSGNDILVLQRGSDWSHLGEMLYRDLWQSPAFVESLGDGFVLVAVDKPEQPGAAALGSTDDPTGLEKFLKVTAPEFVLPPNEAKSVKAAGGAAFKARADGALVVDDPKGEHNPAQEVLTMEMTARQGGRIVRIDFPPDESLPNRCAGRASNGNFALSEVEVASGSKPLKVASAWANASEASMPAAQVIDGIKDQPNNGWNPGAHTRQPRLLMLVLADPLPAGASVQLTLTCKSQWGQHVPGCLRACTFDDEPVARATGRVAEAETSATRNAAFSWWDGGHFPRIAFLDAQGRAIASDDAPRRDLTPARLAAWAQETRKKRQSRDDLLVRAEKQQGPEKAETLRQALVVLGFRNWVGNGNCYKAIHDQIKTADPQDASGATRWLGFSSDPKGGVPWAKPAWNEALDTQGGKRTLTDADYEEALKRIDKELADPRNKILDHENIQRMMVAKFHVYRSWKGHEEERFRIQQEIADFDPATFWGIGARGYIGMYGKSAVPYLTYGWKPNQMKAGLNSWPMTDTSYFFDHAGRYRITLSHAGGAATAKVRRLALLDGQTVLTEAKPEVDLGPGPNAKVEVTVDFPQWQAGKNYVFLTEIETSEGKTDLAGRFSIEPVLVETEEAAATPAIDYTAAQKTLRDKLAAAVASQRENLAKVLASENTRLDVARHELIRRCGPGEMEALAKRQGGAAFLKAFTSDLAWMETFLANDDTKWPQALENLRLLHAHGGSTDQALPRRIATAMALSAGALNPYRLVDRYRDVLRAHDDGLLHAKFDTLDTRELRWAILLSGTAPDYRFMLDATQMRWGDYLGACWQIGYIDPNVYGYSVQGWGYVDPWTHFYGTGTGDRPFRVQKFVGGVCGTLSGFGAAVARAHGVMAVTVGQPGHCAYVVRIGQEWPTGYDVSGPETNGASVFEGTGFPTMHRLYEPMHADKSAYLRSNELAWIAHILLDQTGPAPVKWAASWSGAYGQALAVQPVNYPIRLECIKAMETAGDLPSGTWQKMMASTATALAPYPEAAWALLNRCYAKVAPGLKPEEKVALLLDCHRKLTQSKAPKFMGFNLGGTLNAQADSLGDPPKAVGFFQSLLGIHYSTEANQNRVFGEVLNWGRDRFGKNAATAAAYAQAVGAFFQAQGKTLGADTMRNHIQAGIRQASETGDLAAWKLWTEMAARFLPSPQPGDVHLNAEQAKAAPKFQPPTAFLLSRDGLLQTSSACQFDRPLSYRAVLEGSAPGWFDTNNEQKPWAQVVLAGEAEISTVVAVNRYEYKPDQEEFQWAAPLKLLVSADGKTWTEVAACDKADAVMRFDLNGKTVKARYVRLERQAPADAKASPGRFHLRNFLVYGRKLY